MKSKTILSEEERDRILYNKDTDGYEDANKVLEALVAAEEEIELSNKLLVAGAKAIEETNKILDKNDKELEQKEEVIKLLEIQVKLHFRMSQERLNIIERLHNENQALIEENAGLKAKVEKFSIYRNS